MIHGRLSRLTAVCTAVVVVAWLSSAATAREKYGPFRGQVVDLETGKSIAGAVVLAVWWEAVATPVHGKERFYDAKEALTGPDGRFEIPRLSVPFWKLGVQPPYLTVFIAGYEWQDSVITPPDGEKFVQPTMVRMRRLKTREERVAHQESFPPSIPAKKMPRLLEALNAERASLGFKPILKGTIDE